MTDDKTSIAASGADQVAALLAQQSGLGSSKDPADYRPAKVKFAGPEFNDKDPKYRSDLDPDGFLIGGRPIGPEGVSVIILGSLSGYEEKDRVTINGKEEKRRFAIWKNQPEANRDAPQ